MKIKKFGVYMTKNKRHVHIYKSHRHTLTGQVIFTGSTLDPVDLTIWYYIKGTAYKVHDSATNWLQVSQLTDYNIVSYYEHTYENATKIMERL